jgi:hypothetical protein
MTKYLARPCPRCNGYLGIVLCEPERNTVVQSIRGHCFRCHHRLAWTLIRGKALIPANVPEKSLSPVLQLSWFNTRRYSSANHSLRSRTEMRYSVYLSQRAEYFSRIVFAGLVH